MYLQTTFQSVIYNPANAPAPPNVAKDGILKKHQEMKYLCGVVLVT